MEVEVDASIRSHLSMSFWFNCAKLAVQLSNRGEK